MKLFLTLLHDSTVVNAPFEDIPMMATTPTFLKQSKDSKPPITWEVTKSAQSVILKTPLVN
jgi:hypothetical protein